MYPEGRDEGGVVPAAEIRQPWEGERTGREALTRRRKDDDDLRVKAGSRKRFTDITQQPGPRKLAGDDAGLIRHPDLQV